MTSAALTSESFCAAERQQMEAREGGLGLSVNPWGLAWEGGLQPGTWAGPGAQGKEVE